MSSDKTNIGRAKIWRGFEVAGSGHEGGTRQQQPPTQTLPPSSNHHPHPYHYPPGYHPSDSSTPPSLRGSPNTMRGSPAPPSSIAPPPSHPHHHPHQTPPHMSPSVGGGSSSSGVASHPSPVDSRNSMHAPPYPPNGPPHPPPPHGYPGKMPTSAPSYGQPGGYQQYPGRPQGPSMHPYPQNFPPGGPQTPQGPPHQYPPRGPPHGPPHNSHGPPPSQYNPYPQYAAQQGWGGPAMGQGPHPSTIGSPSMGASKGQHPGQPGQPGSGPGGLPRPHTPPHYLKQHLHQKMPGYGPMPGVPHPSSSQMYPNGPSLPPSMGNSSRDGPNSVMPPPTSTPGPMDSEVPSSSSSQPPAIGPDGNPVVDDASQQSTLSNTSAASGDDSSMTPKAHRDGHHTPQPPSTSQIPPGHHPPPGGGHPMMGGGGGGMMMPQQYGGGVNSPHPSPHPHNSAPSPGAVSMSSDHQEFDNMNSPGWPRSPNTQAGVVFGSNNLHSQQQQPPPPSQAQPPPTEIYRSPKSDNIARLYEMSDSPERRQWLDKLLSYMEENKTPITTCPTISKNPLDLYALYLHVKERGGFVEVTKHKQWKDVAAVMGIGASSSGSYTLRKHYMKNILFYECRFDRGGVDPQPIIAQVESTTKKKSTKNVHSVPSPGSSNSQDSFPTSNSNSMEGGAGGGVHPSGGGGGGYSNGPPHGGMPPYSPYPPSSDYPPPSHMQQRPPQQSQPGYQGYQGSQYPGYQGMHSSYPQGGGYPPSSGYPPDSRGYQGPPPPGGPPGNYHQGYPGQQPPPGAGYPPRGGPGGYPPPPGPPQQPYQQQDQPYSIPPGGVGASTVAPAPSSSVSSTAASHAGGSASTTASASSPTSQHSISRTPPPPSSSVVTPASPSPGGTSSSQHPSHPPVPSSPGGTSNPYGNSQLAKQLLTPSRVGANPNQPMMPHHHHQQHPHHHPHHPHAPPHHHHPHMSHPHHPPHPHGHHPQSVPPPQHQQQQSHLLHLQQKPGAAPSPGPAGSAPGPNGPQAPSSTQPLYQGPRRHPDFEKQSAMGPQSSGVGPGAQTPGSQPPPGWRGPPGSQYPGYGVRPQGNGPPQQPPWAPRPSEGGPPPTPGGSSSHWLDSRYAPSPQSSQSFTNQNRWSGGTFTTGHPGQRPPVPGMMHGKSYIVPPPTSFKSSGYGAYMGKQLFPVDSVEAVLPVLSRRKKMTRHNISSINPWSLLMSLRCGLAAEVTWALDTMNILLFDDQTVVYFGLSHMPGLLDSLLEHWRRGLINMFDICEDMEPSQEETTRQNKKIKREPQTELPWYVQPPASPCSPPLPPLSDKIPSLTNQSTIVLTSGTDYTMVSKTGKPVKMVKREPDSFLLNAMRGEPFTSDSDAKEIDSKMGVSSDFVLIGRTEPTTHFICSMRSEVQALPFAKLLKGKDGKVKMEEIKIKVEESPPKVEVKLEPKEVIKEEKMEVVVPVEEVKEALKNGTKVSEVREETAIVKTCNGAKEESETTAKAPPPPPILSLFSSPPKSTKQNKISKLDAILKRISKTSPIESPTTNCKESDAKSQLDTILVGNVGSCNSVNNKATEKPLVPSLVKTNSKPVVEPMEVEESTKDIKSEPKAPPPTVDKKALVPLNSLVICGKKRSVCEVEEESWSPDEASLCTTAESQDWLAKRVLCTGTVVRNLSFIPGNDEIMGKNPMMMALLGRIILLHHEHPNRTPSTPHYDKEDDTDLGDWCSSLNTSHQWWWPYLNHIHESCLVTLCNISSYLDLSQYPEEIARPILSGLLHWATCPASYGQDPIPSGGASMHSSLSPQRLALEALVKLCVQEQNTDLVLATPPFNRLERLCSQLTRMLCIGEDQVLREFSINLLHYFSSADTGVARLIAMQNGSVSLLISFIEQAESNAMNVANMQGVNALKENPELMGTSLDMVRRAANTLVHLSKVPDNARVLYTCENRLLTLVMSQILDTYVASQLSQVLFNMAQVKCEIPPPTPLPKLPPPKEPASPAETSDDKASLSKKSEQKEPEKPSTVTVPPPAPLNAQDGSVNHQETPVLIAALSEYTKKNATSSVESTTKDDRGKDLTGVVTSTNGTTSPSPTINDSHSENSVENATSNNGSAPPVESDGKHATAENHINNIDAKVNNVTNCDNHLTKSNDTDRVNSSIHSLSHSTSKEIKENNKTEVLGLVKSVASASTSLSSMNSSCDSVKKISETSKSTAPVPSS